VREPLAFRRTPALRNPLVPLSEVDGDGRNPKALTLRREYVWPDSLRFPWVES